jgi:hypothetical protein
MITCTTNYKTKDMDRKEATNLLTAALLAWAGPEGGAGTAAAQGPGIWNAIPICIGLIYLSHSI